MAKEKGEERMATGTTAKEGIVKGLEEGEGIEPIGEAELVEWMEANNGMSEEEAEGAVGGGDATTSSSGEEEGGKKEREAGAKDALSVALDEDEIASEEECEAIARVEDEKARREVPKLPRRYWSNEGGLEEDEDGLVRVERRLVVESREYDGEVEEEEGKGRISEGGGMAGESSEGTGEEGEQEEGTAGGESEAETEVSPIDASGGEMDGEVYAATEGEEDGKEREEEEREVSEMRKRAIGRLGVATGDEMPEGGDGREGSVCKCSEPLRCRFHGRKIVERGIEGLMKENGLEVGVIVKRDEGVGRIGGFKVEVICGPDEIKRVEKVLDEYEKKKGVKAIGAGGYDEEGEMDKYFAMDVMSVEKGPKSRNGEEEKEERGEEEEGTE